MGSFTKPIPPGTIEGEQIADDSVTGQQIDESTLSGVPVEDHTTTHQKDGTDALPVEALPTAESNTSKVLKPDGAGGTAWQDDETGNDEKVKASSGDPTADYLDGKTDGSTIQVSGSEKLEVIDSPALEGQTLAQTRAHDHSTLTGVGTDDHHVRYTDAEAVTAMGAKADSNPLNHDKPICMTQYQQASSDGVSSTSLTAFQEKLKLTNPAAVPAGVYRVGWSCEVANSNKDDEAEVRIQVDDTTVVALAMKPKVDVDGDYIQMSGFGYVTLTNAVHSVDVDYRAVDNTAYIRRARLEFWRLS